MVEYKTLKSEEIKYGNNNFIEVATKEVEGNRFLTISKGYYTPDNNKRYKGGIGLPFDKEIINKITETLNEYAGDFK